MSDARWPEVLSARKPDARAIKKEFKGRLGELKSAAIEPGEIRGHRRSEADVRQALSDRFGDVITNALEMFKQGVKPLFTFIDPSSEGSMYP